MSDSTPATDLRFFKDDELAKHDGSDPSLPLLLSVQGMVFDVSPARSFYGPEGPYAVFAGKECARALALMSTDAKDCTARVGDLDDKQKQTLRDWERKFMGKYKVVGALHGAAWDTGLITAQNKAVDSAQHRPSGHNRPLAIALAGVALAGIAFAASVILSRDG